jgi:hypothetical protein
MYRERVQAVLFKLETTSGSDAIPVGTTDAVRTKGLPVIEVDNLEANPRDDVQTGVLSGADSAQAAGWYGKIDLTIELIANYSGAPSATVLPFYDALWQVCGLARISDFTVGSEFHRYVTIDQGMPTGTLYAFCAGKLVKLVGCCATAKIAANVNQPATVTFSVTGKCIQIQEQGLPTLAFPEVVAGNCIPSVWNGTVSNIGSWLSTSTDPLMMLTANVDLGNVISDLPSAGANDGLVGYAITDRAVTEELSFYVPNLTTFDPFAGTRSPYGGNPTAFVLGTIKNTRITVTTRWKPKKPTFQAKNGMRTYQITGDCKIGGGLTSGREIEVMFN